MDDTKVEAAKTALQNASPEERQAAMAAAGIAIPTPGDIPKDAWSKMRGWQAWSLLIVMFVGLLALFVWLLNKGVDLATAKDASDTAKTVGTTLIGAAIGLLGASAAGAGATAAKK